MSINADKLMFFCWVGLTLITLFEFLSGSTPNLGTTAWCLFAQIVCTIFYYEQWKKEESEKE